MAKVERFEDLECWKAARQLTKLVYRLSRCGPLSKDFRMRDQVTSAALSTMSNIAEGFGRLSRKEFIRFLEFSASSASEVSSIAYAAEDQSYWTAAQSLEVRALTNRVRALNLGLTKYLLRRMNQ